MIYSSAFQCLRAATLASLGLTSSLWAGASKEVLAPTVLEAEEPLFSGSLSAGWDSKYVTEGRDNLDEGGLVSTALEVSALGFTAGAWYGDSYDTEYAELNLGIEYGFEFAGFEAYVGYTYLYFENEGNNDHELGVGLSYTGFIGIGWLVPAVDYVYCDSAEGSFVEFALNGQIPLTGPEDQKVGDHVPTWVLLPSLILGIDMGYATEFHDGANHLQFQLGTEYELTETVTLSGYLAQTLALEDVDQDGGEDLFFGGVSVTVSF